MNALIQLDLGLLHLVNGWSGTWPVDRAVGFAAGNAFFKGAVFMGAYWWFWFLPGPRQQRRAHLIFALMATIGALFVARLLALGLPFRSRPLYTDGIDFHVPSVSATAQSLGFENWSSFPSDHTAMFFALACGLWRLSRPASVAAMMFATVWVGLPRLYLGIHYPSDLAAGAVIGASCVYIANRIQYRPMVTALLEFERRYQHVFYAVMFLTTFEIATLFTDIRDFMHGSVLVLKTTGLTLIKLFEILAAGLGVATLLAVGLLIIVRKLGRLRPIRPSRFPGDSARGRTAAE